MTSVLMFGNDYQGHLLAMQHPDRPVEVLAMQHPDRLVEVLLHGGSVGEHPALRVLRYEPRKLVIFGVTMVLHVEQNLAEERLEAMLADHLLSDKAKAVIRGPW